MAVSVVDLFARRTLRKGYQSGKFGGDKSFKSHSAVRKEGFNNKWKGGDRNKFGGGGGYGRNNYEQSQPVVVKWDESTLTPFPKNLYKEHPNTEKR